MSDSTTLGLKKNIEACIAYSIPPLSPISGLVMLVLERENKFVQFHAMQSFIVFTALAFVYWITNTIFNWIPLLGGIVMWVAGTLVMSIWLTLIISAFFGKTLKFPVVGDVIYRKIM